MNTSLFLNALHGRNDGRAPIWLMRQAGRYMPQYRKIKGSHPLKDLFHHPELIAEITQLPYELLGVDALILFSDILMVLDGLGVNYVFEEQRGPIILDPIETLSVNPADMTYGHIYEGIQLIKKDLHVPLIGFCGGPFTIATYLLEKGHSKEFAATKKLMYSYPSEFHSLLEKITEATIDYLNVQIEAGVDALQIFDSWAGILSRPNFKIFSLYYLKRVKEGLKKEVPLILFCRGSCQYAEELSTLLPHAVSLDWSEELGIMRARMPQKIALQGNLDPGVLLGTPQSIEKAAYLMLKNREGDPGYIFNLGHGVLPMTPYENVLFLVDYVKNYTRTSPKIS
jgi:uroporphyrinogen decarboxylase